MKFCPNCGSALTGADKFCGECGAPLVEANIGKDTVDAKGQEIDTPQASSAEEHDASVGRNSAIPPVFVPTAGNGQQEITTRKNSPSKKAITAGALILVVVAVGCLAAWLLSSGAPSYDKICRMNDELKQARQLGLSTQEKCSERLGTAILRTTDESLLANLLSNETFESKFADAILGKIQSPEAIETVARTFKAERLADSSDDPLSESSYNAVLDRLPDDSAVERIFAARLAEIGGASDTGTGIRGKNSSGRIELATCLCRRILAMDDIARAATLLEKLVDLDALRNLPLEMRLSIALRSKNKKVRQATGVNREYLELGDLVAKWDPNCLSRSVREIIARGREIQNAQEYVEVVKRFDPDFKSNDIDKWVEYAKSVTPVLEAIERLSAKSKEDSSDSFRRSRLVEKQDKARKKVEECNEIKNDLSNSVGVEYAISATAACQVLGVYMDQSDPVGTGERLAYALKARLQRAEKELKEAERELDALDSAAASQRASTNGQISKLKAQLEQIRRRYETPESRKAREEREAAEREEARIAREKEEKERAERVEAILLELIGNMIQIPGKKYKMGKYEVTQAQWEAIMGENPSRFKGENNPVETVSWDDCQGFLSFLNSIPVVKNSGLTFRLPTEEEWEYACRAGATGDYCLLAGGTEITESTLGLVAWFKNNADIKTHPVGQKQPNAFGLYDMLGNVEEWTSTVDGENRVNRGGSWLDSARYCESSLRVRGSSSNRGNVHGFRLCASGRAD